MITRNIPIDINLDYSYDFDIDKIIFFDIETTGFSADTSYLYLIGCIYHDKSSFHLIQWFSENIKEEASLLTAFFEFIKTYDALIHFNGNGFDIPYLLRKCSQLDLDYNFDQINSIDIYKKLLPYKKILRLKSYKLKSIEDFLKVKREDKLSGGDLIEVYQSYLGKKHLEVLRNRRMPEEAGKSPSEAEMLLHELLLHNEDDIKGLVKISPILNYTDLFEKAHIISKAEVNGDLLNIHCDLPFILPVRVYLEGAYESFTASNTSAVLSVRIYEGELKYFYDNYKDYYYLPAEDSVVHKSLAAYVDKDYRQKAKPANCYIRKTGLFVPQYEAVLNPCFKFNLRDKITFIEIHTDFLLKEENLEIYVSHMLLNLLNAKEKL